jgi:hypothetical protein
VLRCPYEQEQRREPRLLRNRKRPRLLSLPASRSIYSLIAPGKASLIDGVSHKLAWGLEVAGVRLEKVVARGSSQQDNLNRGIVLILVFELKASI